MKLAKLVQLHRFLAPKPYHKAQHGDRRVEVVVLHVHVEEAEDVSIHGESEHRHESVDEAEDDEEEPGVAVIARGEKRHEARDEVHDVMDGVDLEDEQRAIDEESCDSDDEEHDPEDFRDEFHEGGHEWKGERIFPSIVRFYSSSQGR